MLTSRNCGEGWSNALEMPTTVARVAEHHIFPFRSHAVELERLRIASATGLAIAAAPGVAVDALNDPRILEREAGRMAR